MKPILFNTEMVQAILDGRKTVTRRVVKFPEGQTGRLPSNGARDYLFYPGGIKYPPYQVGDILYVRETWFEFRGGGYAYAADATESSKMFRKELGYKWHPSIHMPKEAARLFLRVTNVSVARLWDITIKEIQAEGVKSLPGSCKCAWRTETCMDEPCGNRDSFESERWRIPFLQKWDSTIKKADLSLYGWDANPWVWVIEFERISKEEAQKGGEG